MVFFTLANDIPSEGAEHFAETLLLSQSANSLSRKLFYDSQIGSKSIL